MLFINFHYYAACQAAIEDIQNSFKQPVMLSAQLHEINAV